MSGGTGDPRRRLALHPQSLSMADAIASASAELV
jgi:hypothetical protein